jgi:hypothetical protein
MLEAQWCQKAEVTTHKTTTSWNRRDWNDTEGGGTQEPAYTPQKISS